MKSFRKRLNLTILNYNFNGAAVTPFKEFIWRNVTIVVQNQSIIPEIIVEHNYSMIRFINICLLTSFSFFLLNIRVQGQKFIQTTGLDVTRKPSIKNNAPKCSRNFQSEHYPLKYQDNIDPKQNLTG